MSVYKEGYHAVKLIMQRSTRLYPDACDYGAATKKGDDIWNWAKQLCDWYGVADTRRVETYLTGTTVTQEVELMDEWTTGKVERFRVTFVTTRGEKRMDGYVQVEPLTN